METGDYLISNWSVKKSILQWLKRYIFFKGGDVSDLKIYGHGMKQGNT